MTVDLYNRDGDIVATLLNDDPMMPMVVPQVFVWGARSFALNTEGHYVEVTSVDQAVRLPFNIPPPAWGAVN